MNKYACIWMMIQEQNHAYESNTSQTQEFHCDMIHDSKLSVSVTTRTHKSSAQKLFTVDCLIWQVLQKSERHTNSVKLNSTRSLMLEC